MVEGETQEALLALMDYFLRVLFLSPLFVEKRPLCSTSYYILNA